MDFENGRLKLKVIFFFTRAKSKNQALQWFDLQGNLCRTKGRRNKFSLSNKIRQIETDERGVKNDLACE